MSASAMEFAIGRDAEEGVEVEACLLRQEKGPSSVLARRPVFLTVGLVVVAVGATAVAIGTGRLSSGPKRVRDLSDPSQLWIRRDLQSIDWEPPCFELHKSMETNIQAVWDSFMDATSMEDELSDSENKDFKKRFKTHVILQTKGFSAESLHGKCKLWKAIVKQDLNDDKPLVSEALVTAFSKTNHSFTIAVTPNVKHLSHSDLKWRTGAMGTDLSDAIADKLLKDQPGAVTTASHPPAEFDAVQAWPQCAEVINRSHNQGTCGSCWAFGAAHVLDSRLCIATDGAFQSQLSRTHLTSCTYDGHDGCQGGWDYDVMDHMATDGVPTGGLGGCAPYFGTGDGTEHFDKQDVAPQCPSTCHNQDYVREMDEDTFRIPELKNYHFLPITTYWSLLQSLAGGPFSGYAPPADWKAQVKRAIMAGGPLSVSVACDDAFMAYADGVYDVPCDPNPPNHVVSTIGWGSAPAEHFVIANSWGSDWGVDGGKMRLIPEAFCSVLSLPVIDGSGSGIKVDGLQPDGRDESTTTPTPAPPDADCQDTPPSWEDSAGNSCADYKENPTWCELFSHETNEGGTTPGKACCACNGGSSHHASGEETGKTDVQHIQTKGGFKCVFPFTYMGYKYESCTAHYDYDERPWCATEVYDSGEVKNWDHCAGIDLPWSLGPFTVNKGPCQLGVGSLQGCVLNSHYGINEECTITVPKDGVTLYSHRFDTEGGEDKLFVNAQPYSGNALLYGVHTSQDILWESDWLGSASGWVICDHAP